MRAIILSLSLLMLSCSVSKDLTGEKACRVIEKKYERGHYYTYRRLTLFSKQLVYVSGFEKDAYVNDTVTVVVRYDGFNYFKKGER